MHDRMLIIVIKQLIWNEWNIAHIARHEVVPEEVEEVFHGLYVARETYRERFLVVGQTQKGRILTIVLAQDSEEETYYPITAFTSDKKDRKWYQSIMMKGGEQVA
jgi:uncharacterized protein